MTLKLLEVFGYGSTLKTESVARGGPIDVARAALRRCTLEELQGLKVEGIGAIQRELMRAAETLPPVKVKAS